MAANAGTLELLQLEPFIHQVGGQSSILQLDETTICKPFISQEYNFYVDIPDILKPFIPEFRGDIEVTFTTDSEGYITLTTHSVERYNAACQNSKCDSTAFQKQKSERAKCRIRIGHSGTVEIISSSDDDAIQVFEEGDQVDGSNGISHNPWALRCLRRQFNKLSTSPTPASQSFSVKFILLENLTYKYVYPCVLDLKMGTRQFGDDATLVKRQLHEAKVASTTSKTLGVRLCGMQVYHLNSGHFVCHNKYYGRSLSVEGFKQALYIFLHNGQKFRHDVIAPLIQKLQMMHDVIQQLDTYRFYSCSLLVLYDGITEESCLKNPSSNGNDNIEEKNRNSIQLECSKRKQSARQSQNVTGGVDVRLIDFAHSTHCNLPQNTMAHSGPDKGLLFGLQNLIRELECINQEYS